MTRYSVIFLAVFAALMGKVDAECANACNGHGKCVGYDMCICNRNWQANDCSERVCMHGLAHVDTPKGDLDMSGDVIKPGAKVVADNSFQYPYGTTEQFPQMEDSDLNELTNSAHYYMECSNKGTCDRDSGECECFDGYDGVACQRASCPGFPASCSGHGVCKTAKQLAEADNGNVYKLWNKDATMGCECDSGYFGADCSERHCKTGVDPLYLDDSSTVKYSIWDFATLTTAATADFDDGHPTQGDGYWAIRFFDATGEDWVTAPIKAGSTCAQVKQALYDLPNDVIPPSTLHCTLTTSENAEDNGQDNIVANAWNNTDAQSGYPINYRMSIWDAYIHKNQNSGGEQAHEGVVSDLGNHVYTPLDWMPGSMTTEADATGTGTDIGTGADARTHLSGHIYRIKFFGNPGKLAQPEIITRLDGKRNSLKSTTFAGVTTETTVNNAVITKVWTDGQQGEDKDYFADHCDGVTATIVTNAVDVSGDAHMNNFNNAKTYELRVGGTACSGADCNAQYALLKKCLGNSDATSTNNVEIYDWDYGSDDYPHLIKLVRTVTTYTDGGYYVAIKYDTSGSNHMFKMMNPFVPPDAVLTDTYEVYTTKGTLSRVSREAQAYFGFASKKVITTHTPKANHNGEAARWDGDISCEVGDNNGFRVSPSTYTEQLSTFLQDETKMDTLASGTISTNGNGVDVFINDVVTHWDYNYEVQPSKRTATAFYKNCVNKTDIITFINTENVNLNAPHLNLYTVERLVKDKTTWSNYKRFGTTAEYEAGTAVAGSGGSTGRKLAATNYDQGAAMNFGTNIIDLDISTNWGVDLGKDDSTALNALSHSPYYIYKFVPHVDSTYEYVAECSNRGLCDRESGQCECFNGYTNDNCDTQSSLAI